MKTKIAIWLTGEIGLALFFGSFSYWLWKLSPAAWVGCTAGAMLIVVAGAAELKEGEQK